MVERHPSLGIGNFSDRYPTLYRMLPSTTTAINIVVVGGIALVGYLLFARRRRS